jgi:hypothetical protein
MIGDPVGAITPLVVAASPGTARHHPALRGTKV